MTRTSIVVLALAFTSIASAQQRPQDLAAAAAERAFTEARARWASGTETLDSVYVWSVRWLEADRRAHPESLPRALQAHRARVHDLCAEVDRAIRSGTAPASASTACTYYEAEASLAR